jgi:hypothetical protein
MDVRWETRGGSVGVLFIPLEKVRPQETGCRGGMSTEYVCTSYITSFTTRGGGVILHAAASRSLRYRITRRCVDAPTRTPVIE